ncbi:TIGR03756 family integrating conjugative element protein [Vibrio europaeus]|uniref:TIGR03756 family integrating conjugative element protein n=1 Tax=Vibrio europaeus TaxID=300876 RepID=UPI00233EABD3|nr:TIGR03756 family integrating conjugative element protein [Vibrio europaeus]MDC5870262.1 TIGR03756 family integrating conjugative element protein [Vibrio europaeus]
MHTLIKAAAITAAVVTFSSQAESVKSKPITTADIVGNSLDMACIDWKPTGVCIWLRCTITGCSTESSLRVKHFNPDAIVQVYNETDDAPWEETEFIIEALNLSQEGGETSTIGNTKKDYKKISSKFISKEASVIGSPGLLPVGKMLSSYDYFCESPVTPYMPYYISGLDKFGWKYPYADLLKPSAFIPGMDEVGERSDGQYSGILLGRRFGNVYPRIGKLMSNDDYKASTVFAQRAADIVTDSFSMHVSRFLGNKGRSPSNGEWPQQKVEVYTSKHGKWQMLSPKLENKCHIFGEPSTRGAVSVASGDGYGDRRSESGGYSWQFWRPYECCARKGQTLIKVIEFGER